MPLWERSFRRRSLKSTDDKEQADKPRRRKMRGGRKRLLKPYQEVLLTLIYIALQPGDHSGSVQRLTAYFRWGLPVRTRQNSLKDRYGLRYSVHAATRTAADRRNPQPPLPLRPPDKSRGPP